MTLNYNSKYEAVLFDLDGTLLDTAKDIIAACNYTLKKYGYDEVDESILRTKVTAGMREMLKLGVPKDKWEESGIETFMRDCFSDYYTENICVNTTPYPGIEELITKLTNIGVKTGVITNKYLKHASKILSKFEFTKNFSIVLGCDSLTHYKPHPEPILKAIETLNVQANKAIYIGDHINDIKASNAAFVDSAVALWGYGIKECGNVDNWNAKYKVNNVNELSKLIFC